MTLDWDPNFLERSPMFEPLRHHGAALRLPHWPTISDLQRVLSAREPPLTARSGVRIAFVAQRRPSRVFEEKYEPRVYLYGEVQMREGNWHDLLNALVWLTFPRAKAELNRRHYDALLEQRTSHAPNRGPVQDAMTLFDEGGVVVAARDRELLQLLENYAWKDLFWLNRSRVIADMRFYLFGHALYEKALDPFTGITGRSLLFEVEAGFFDAPPEVAHSCLDEMIAGRLADAGTLRSPRELAPVPILGVPGWCADNVRDSYYDNADYFRTGRARRSMQ
jgi:hypothetical protein